MAASDDLVRENTALGERLARLSEAGMRVAEDLDLDTVLREVLDAARSKAGRPSAVSRNLCGQFPWSNPAGTSGSVITA